jgi:hypothetical protein
MNGRYQVSARLHGPVGLQYHPPEKINTFNLALLVYFGKSVPTSLLV